MRTIGRTLLALCAVVLFVIGASAFLLAFAPGPVKDGLSTLVTNLTDRDFRIDGRFQVEVGWQTTLTGTDIRLANAEWGAAGDIGRIGQAKIVLDLPALLRGLILIELVEIDDAVITLETSESGEHNWMMGGGTPTNEGDGGAAFDFLIHHARIRNLDIAYTSPRQPTPLNINLDYFEQSHAEDNMLAATLDGNINGKPVALDVSYGPYPNLRTGVDLDIDIDASFDTLTIVGRGHLDDVLDPRQPSFDLRIEGPEIDHVTEMLGLSSLGNGTLDLDASLKRVDDGLEANVKGNLGRYQISADSAFSNLAEPDRLDFDARIDGPNLGRVMEWFGLSNIPQDPFDLSGKVTLSQRALDIDQVTLNLGGARFDLDGTLANFPELDGANLNLKVGGDDLSRFRELFDLPGAASGRFEISGALKVSPDGKELIDVNLKTEIADLTITGTITEPPTFIGSHLKYSGSGPNLQTFGNTYGYPSLIPEPFNIAGEIEVATEKLITEEMIQVTVGNNQLTIDGTISFNPLESGTSVQIHARGSSLAEIAGMAGLSKNVPRDAYDLDGHLEIAAGGYRIQNLRGSVGDTRIAASGTISKSADFSGSTIELSVSGPDLAPLIVDIEDLSHVEGPFEASGKFELASDEARIEQMILKAGGAELSLDAVVALPLDFADTQNSKGNFDITAYAPDLSAILPKMELYEPDASSAALRARGNWRKGLWVFELAEISLGDETLTFRGEVDQPPDWSSTHLQLDVAIASLANLGLINGQRLPATNLEFTAQFSGTPDMFKIDNLSGKFSDGDFAGRLAFLTGTEPPEIDIDIDSNRIDLSPFLQQDDQPGGNDDELILQVDISEPLIEETEDQLTAGAAKSNDDGLVIPNWPLPLDPLNQFDADVAIDARVVQLAKIALHDFALHAVVEDGALTVDRLAAQGQDGAISAALSVTPDNGSATVALTFVGTDLYTKVLTDLSDEEAANAPRYAADVNLTGQGLTLREIASSLNGRIKLTSDGGLFRNQGGGLLYGSFFEELLVALNPFRAKEAYTEMVCAVFLADVLDGIVNADPSLVIQTDKMNIISKGTLNLATEKINLNFNTGARKGIGISAGDFINPYIKVAGTLAKPRLALDAPTAAVTTGAAVVTFGVSMLATAAARRIFRKKDPCGAALAEAKKKQAKAAKTD